MATLQAPLSCPFPHGPITFVICIFPGHVALVFGHQSVLKDFKSEGLSPMCGCLPVLTIIRGLNHPRSANNRGPLPFQQPHGCFLSSGVYSPANDSLGKRPVLSVYTAYLQPHYAVTNCHWLSLCFGEVLFSCFRFIDVLFRWVGMYSQHVLVLVPIDTSSALYSTPFATYFSLPCHMSF